MFTDDGFGYVSSEAGVRWCSRQLFGKRLYQVDGRAYTVCCDTDESVFVVLPPLREHYLQMPPTEGGKRFYFKMTVVPFLATVFKHIWEVRLLPLPLGLDGTTASAKRWTWESWSYFIKVVGALFPVFLLLRKAVSRDKKDLDFQNITSDRGFSTTMLVLLLVDRTLSCRPPELRPHAQHLFVIIFATGLGWF